MPSEYYKAPDWASLQEVAEASLYTDHDSIDKGNEVDDYDLSKQPGEGNDLSVLEDEADAGNCGPPEDETEGFFSNSDGSRAHASEPELAPVVLKTHTQTSRARTYNGNNRHKHADAKNSKDRAIRSRNNTAVRLFDLLSVVILAAFSIVAFAMYGFVKEHAAETYLGVFLVCFIANSTVLLPAPSILVVLQYSMILNPVVVAICGALGASLGEMVGFMTGAHGRHFVSGKLIKKVEDHFPNHPYIFVLVFSALPLPLFDVVGMMAGAIRLDKLKFYLICLAGKLFKMLVFVWMGQVVANIIPR